MEVDFIGLDVGLKISGDSISRKDLKKRERKKKKKKIDFSTVKKTTTYFQFLVHCFSFSALLTAVEILLTSVVVRTVDYGVVLFILPLQILFLTRERSAHLCHLAGVLTAPAWVHGAPVQP